MFFRKRTKGGAPEPEGRGSPRGNIPRDIPHGMHKDIHSAMHRTPAREAALLMVLAAGVGLAL